MSESWQEVAVFRSEIYRFLGHCMLAPIGLDRISLLQPEYWLNFALAPANDSMCMALERLSRITKQLQLLPETESLEKIQLEYTTLFLGPGEPIAPPWESMYSSTDERLFYGPPALEVRSAMARFGVEVVAKYSQPEDHLGLELMLLASAAERDAMHPDANWCESAALQAVFIETHPLGWVGKLSQDADTQNGTGFYSAIIQLIHGVLLWDRELLAEYTGS